MNDTLHTRYLDSLEPDGRDHLVDLWQRISELEEIEAACLRDLRWGPNEQNHFFAIQRLLEKFTGVAWKLVLEGTNCINLELF